MVFMNLHSPLLYTCCLWCTLGYNFEFFGKIWPASLVDMRKVFRSPLIGMGFFSQIGCQGF